LKLCAPKPARTQSPKPLAVSVGRPDNLTNKMTKINFQILQHNDQTTFQLIADWYLSEWKIPREKTIQRLQTITADNSQFQILMTLDGTPISTGGLYDHVGLLDKEPRLKIHKNWLALVYTIPDKRHQGYGALICKHIQDLSKKLGLGAIYLFTDTAEQLYKRLGWTEMERVNVSDRNVVIMRKDLLNDNEG
jgi:GNAT superfamily N-acetyltransferase